MKKSRDERPSAAGTSSSGRARPSRPGAALLGHRGAGGERAGQRAHAQPPAQPGRDYTPVVVPNGAKLPWKVVDGVKVFHLIAEEVEHEFAPGPEGEVLGLQRPRPRPGDRGGRGRSRAHLRHQPAARRRPRCTGTACCVPNGMDGVGGLTQKAIPPGETFKYEFTLRQHGTFMYHPHHDEMTQMALGMMGMFVIHPRSAAARTVDRDFALMLHEWRIDPGAQPPESERDDRLQRAHDERQGVPRHRAAGRADRRARAHPPRQPERDGPPPDPPARLPLQDHRDRRRRDPRRRRSGRRRRCSCRSAARARSSSSPTSRATGRCTAT